MQAKETQAGLELEGRKEKVISDGDGEGGDKIFILQ